MLKIAAVFCLLCASAAVHAAVQGGVEQPWPTQYVQRLPAAFQKAARQHVRSTTAHLKELHDLNDRELFYFAMDEIAETDAGAQALVQIFETAPDLEDRMQVAIHFGEDGQRFARDLQNATQRYKPYSPETYAKVVHAMEKQIITTAHADYALKVLNELTKLQRRRLQPLMETRLGEALKQADAGNADLFRRKGAELFFGRNSLAQFMYRAPAVFQAAPRAQQQVSVVVLGDFGTGQYSQFQTAAAMRAYDAENPFTLGLTVGDNFYTFGLDTPDHERWKTQWEEPYGPLGIKFYPTFGNHDYLGVDSPAAELAYSARSSTWEFPAPFYTFTAGLAQFFALDTLALYDDQLRWLEQALSTSTARWKVVYGHHPVYLSSLSSAVLERRPDSMISRLLPVLKRGRADVYLAGHHHSLQELKPDDGVHFFVVGAGGAALYDHDPHYPRRVFTSDAFGFGVLDIRADTLSVSLVSADGRTLHRREIRRPQS